MEGTKQALTAADAGSLPEPVPVGRRPVSPMRQYVQFAAVGLLNAAVDLIVLNVLMLIWPTTNTIGMTVENSLAVALAIANSFLWNTRWTFRRQADGSLRQMILFVSQSLLNIGINDLALVLTAGQVRHLHLGPAWVSLNLSKGLAMALASSTSFVIMRKVVFRRW